MLLTPTIDVLGEDPSAIFRLNAYAYQQSAIASFAGFQYAAFYTPGTTTSGRYVTLARRDIKQNPAVWHSFTFTDYEQTVDDGHNTISFGICRGNGTVHVAFDHHCDVLKYRVSRPGLASDAHQAAWNSDSFGPICDRFPTKHDDGSLFEVTYPRFVPVEDRMFFECRIGKAGAGSDILYIYDPNTSQFTFLGTYLIGRQCNPYPNGLTIHPGTNTLHVTWTNRHFIEYEGVDNPSSTAHKVQAGPNGPENNEGLYHAYSNDWGRSWWASSSSSSSTTNSNTNKPVAILSPQQKNTGLDSRDPNLLAREIPRNSGIMNQEAQTVDSHGGVHVLNRENRNPGGEERWIHYYRRPNPSGECEWSSSPLPFINPTESGPRGKVVHHATSDRLYFILPSNTQSELVVLRSGNRDSQGNFSSGDFEIVWRGQGYMGEPLVDGEALSGLGVLSVFTTREVAGGEKRAIVVLHFPLDVS